MSCEITHVLHANRQLLHAMSMPVVTNFRASNDYYYGGSFKIGTSSLLIWAAGQAPSKVLPSTQRIRSARWLRCWLLPSVACGLITRLSVTPAGHVLDLRQLSGALDVHLGAPQCQRCGGRCVLFGGRFD
jgi:hypothetical protein|eukprot:SAG25_NODE_851_length_5076_cov_2.739401_8_plen_130_part_00